MDEGKRKKERKGTTIKKMANSRARKSEDWERDNENNKERSQWGEERERQRDRHRERRNDRRQREQ